VAAFLNCVPRDWSAVLSAIGPTIAAGIAVAVAIWQVVVSHSMLKRERRRTAPRVGIQKKVTAKGVLQETYVALTNVGETRATVQDFEIAVDGEPFTFDPTEAAAAQWTHLLDRLGIVGLRAGGEFNVYFPPFSLAAGQTLVLLRAPIHGPNSDLPGTVKDRLKCSGTYTSIWGDTGAFPPPPPKPAWWRRWF
jgi:hypothetical protein